MLMLGGGGLLVFGILIYIFFFNGNDAKSQPEKNKNLVDLSEKFSWKDMASIHQDKEQTDTNNKSSFITKNNYRPATVGTAQQQPASFTSQQTAQTVQYRQQPPSPQSQQQLQQIKKIREISSSNYQHQTQEQQYLNERPALTSQQNDNIISMLESQKLAIEQQRRQIGSSTTFGNANGQSNKEQSNNIEQAPKRHTWLSFTGTSKRVTKFIKATVLKATVAENGTIIDIVSESDFFMNGKTIAAQTVLSGVIENVENNRIKLDVYGLQNADEPQQIVFKVYDTDGLEGIRTNNNGSATPGAGADAALSETQSNIQSAATSMPVPVVGGAVRVLGSIVGGRRKQHNLKAFLPAGYKITLKPVLTDN